MADDDPLEALRLYELEWEAKKKEHRKKLRRLRYAADVGGERSYMRRYRKQNPDKAKWNDAKHNLARSLGLPVKVISDELIEAKLAQLEVLRATREAEGGNNG